MKRSHYSFGTVLGAILATFFAAMIVLPLVWMLLNSFKTTEEIFSRSWVIPTKFMWENYRIAWNAGISSYLLNSIFVTILTIVVTLLAASMYAFALTALSLRAHRSLYLLGLGGLMISPIVAVIPLYQQVQTMGLYNNLWSLIIVYGAFQFSMCFMLIHAFFASIDRSYLEAARIDGCRSWQILYRIYLPMSRPILLTATVLTGFYAWNEFVFSLLFIKDDLRKTVPVGLLTFQGEMHSEWGIMLAGLSLFTIPMVFFFVAIQRHFVAGLSSGGVKG